MHTTQAIPTSTTITRRSSRAVVGAAPEPGQPGHLMLLSTPTGRPVSATMLRDRYELARERAAVRAYIANDDEFARQIKAMVLRDMRKRAADLADDAGEAQQLLQHGSRATTVRHYRTRAEKLKPAR